MRLLPTFLLAAAALTARAQQLPVPRNIQAAYAKGTRAESGLPGPRYWQNTADYNLKVSFDPTTRLIQGTVEITYRNNSPDSLRQLWFKLYPNLYQKGAPRDASIAPADLTDGVQIQQLTINGQATTEQQRRIDATNMVVPVPAGAIGPGQTAQVTVAYSYTLNKGSHQRTGEVAPGAAFVAYFFPRIAVYDDIDGWNRAPYTGSQEFYNDFCTFRADITVPQNFVVWATGDLTNAAQVLTKKYAERLRAAAQQDGITTIISPAEARRRDVTAPNAQNSWHFEAQDVTDFVFATADHYVWQASSLVVDPATGRRTRVDAAYSPKHKDYEEVIDFARGTVRAMSYDFPKWPYPYAHETVFDGLDQMEYPMMVNDNPTKTRDDAITLTDHEIFHTMFPFYMGINETKYGWMDEGWATIGEWLISPLLDPKLVDEYGVAAYARAAATEQDLPIAASLTTQQTGAGSFLNAYPKPGLGYLYVRDLLGEALFTKALHTYIERWHGKHPMPYDFFNSMNAGAGQDLSWFWQRWFFDSGYPDLALQSVTRQTNGYQVVVAAPGTKPVPVDLTITFTDGTTQQLHRTVAVWQSGATAVTLDIPTTKTARKMVLGSTYVPDSFPGDNVWEGR